METLTEGPWAKLSDTYVKEREIAQKKFEEGLTHKIVSQSGIDIIVPDETAKSTISKKLLKESEDEFEIRNKLKNLGIQVLGVLPTELFDELTDKIKFYQLKTLKNGYIHVSKQKVESSLFDENGSIINFIGSFIASFILFLTTIHYVSVYSAFNLLVSGTITFAIGSVFAYLIHHKGVEEKNWFLITPFVWIGRLRTKYLRYKSTLPNYAMPNYRDGGSYLLKIQIAQPPVDKNGDLTAEGQLSVDIATKCYNNNVKTFLTADRSAFRLSIDDEVEQKWRQINPKDPILCTNHGSVTAILCQYGDFDKEKELVDYIENHFNQLSQKHLLKSMSIN